MNNDLNSCENITDNELYDLRQGFEKLKSLEAISLEARS